MNEEEIELQVEIQKRVAYHQMVLSVWRDSKMGLGKHIFALSTLAIGLLLTFRGEIETAVQFWIWIGAGAAFIFAAILILFIIGGNSDYAACIIRGEDSLSEKEKFDGKLNQKARVAYVSFAVGVVLTVILAVAGTEFVAGRLI